MSQRTISPGSWSTRSTTCENHVFLTVIRASPLCPDGSHYPRDPNAFSTEKPARTADLLSGLSSFEIPLSNLPRQRPRGFLPSIRRGEHGCPMLASHLIGIERGSSRESAARHYSFVRPLLLASGAWFCVQSSSKRGTLQPTLERCSGPASLVANRQGVMWHNAQ